MTVDGAAGAGPTNAAAGASASATTRACVAISSIERVRVRPDASAHSCFGRAFCSAREASRPLRNNSGRNGRAVAHAPQK